MQLPLKKAFRLVATTHKWSVADNLIRGQCFGPINKEHPRALTPAQGQVSQCLFEKWPVKDEPSFYALHCSKSKSFCAYNIIKFEVVISHHKLMKVIFLCCYFSLYLDMISLTSSYTLISVVPKEQIFSNFRV